MFPYGAGITAPPALHHSRNTERSSDEPRIDGTTKDERRREPVRAGTRRGRAAEGECPGAAHRQVASAAPLAACVLRPPLGLLHR